MIHLFTAKGVQARTYFVSYYAYLIDELEHHKEFYCNQSVITHNIGHNNILGKII